MTCKPRPGRRRLSRCSKDQYRFDKLVLSCFNPSHIILYKPNNQNNIYNLCKQNMFVRNMYIYICNMYITYAVYYMNVVLVLALVYFFTLSSLTLQIITYANACIISTGLAGHIRYELSAETFNPEAQAFPSLCIESAMVSISLPPTV